MKIWINALEQGQKLSSLQYKSLLQSRDADITEHLTQSAARVATSNFEHKIFVRGLIEISNDCTNNCYYCGIRCSNREVQRYSLSMEQILECCRVGHECGIRTFVLQSGENRRLSIDWLVDVVSQIRHLYPQNAITLSLGEMSEESYRRLYEAGANRYLLRHEAINPELYAKIHPRSMSHSHRIESLFKLKEIGYQTGSGFMVGVPHQRIDDIVEDIEFLAQFQPQMIGIGPFIPHAQTPFSEMGAGDIDLTLKVISLVRLMNPKALIPSTTALATLSPEGRNLGILAGANVVMPNLSPLEIRSHYALYNNKTYSGAESAEGLRLLASEFNNIGYTLSLDRGDYKE